METPLLDTPTPTNLSLSLPNHHHSKCFSFTSLTFKPNLHRITIIPTPVAFNGNPHLYKHDHASACSPCELLIPIRVIGPSSNFLQMDPQEETSSNRTVLVKSSASDSNNISTSTLSQKVSKFIFISNKKENFIKCY